MFTDNVYIILCFTCNFKKSETTAKLSKRSVVLIVVNGVLYHTHAYTVTISYCRSSLIRYQKVYILISDCIGGIPLNLGTSQKNV